MKAIDFAVALALYPVMGGCLTLPAPVVTNARPDQIAVSKTSSPDEVAVRVGDQSVHLKRTVDAITDEVRYAVASDLMAESGVRVLCATRPCSTTLVYAFDLALPNPIYALRVDRWCAQALAGHSREPPHRRLRQAPSAGSGARAVGADRRAHAHSQVRAGLPA